MPMQKWRLEHVPVRFSEAGRATITSGTPNAAQIGRRRKPNLDKSVVHYPINNYDVSLNIGNYQHFADRLGSLPLDFYALAEDLDKAKAQFPQAK
jgi:hypothetical protein